MGSVAAMTNQLSPALHYSTRVSIVAAGICTFMLIMQYAATELVVTRVDGVASAFFIDGPVSSR